MGLYTSGVQDGWHVGTWNQTVLWGWWAKMGNNDFKLSLFKQQSGQGIGWCQRVWPAVNSPFPEWRLERRSPPGCSWCRPDSALDPSTLTHFRLDRRTPAVMSASGSSSPTCATHDCNKMYMKENALVAINSKQMMKIGFVTSGFLYIRAKAKAKIFFLWSLSLPNVNTQ